MLACLVDQDNEHRYRNSAETSAEVVARWG
jgi:hypothetical protein